MGYSYHLHDRITRVILTRMMWTLALVGMAIILGALGGTLLGAISGWGRNSLKNRSSTFFFPEAVSFS